MGSNPTVSAKTKMVNKSFVNYVIEQIQDIGHVSHKYMFGGCAIYYKNIVIALICDNQLFIRPTTKGKAYIKGVTEESPYPGAKPHFLINEIDDKEWLCELIKITANELPESKMRKT